MTAVVARPAGRARAASFVDESMRTIRIDGVDARYLIAGSGPPLLVVASPLVFASAYRRIVRRLASSFTVVIVEPPGAGGSSRLERAWTAERYGSWLVDLVRRMPLAAPIVVGHADSAPMVMEAARIAPRELRGIVLVGPPCGNSERFLRLRLAPDLVKNLVRHRLAFRDHVRAASRADCSPLAAVLDVPTLIACGDRDRTVPLARASRLAGAIAGAKLVVLPRSGSHDWMASRTDAFAATVRRFSAEIVKVGRC